MNYCCVAFFCIFALVLCYFLNQFIISVIKYLSKINQSTEVQIEIGVQALVGDQSGQKNRGKFDFSKIILFLLICVMVLLAKR